MSAFKEHREELEHYEQMFGRDRGRLAVSLDRLTNALVLVGQHAVYCTSQPQSRSSGDGPAHHRPGTGARKRIGAVGNGRTASRQDEEGKLKLGKRWPAPEISILVARMDSTGARSRW